MKESSVMRAELRRLLYITFLAVPFSLGLGLKNAVAQSYPVTVTDMAGRHVTITATGTYCAAGRTGCA